MRKSIKNLFTDEVYDVNVHFSQSFRGRGHWSISCEVTYNGVSEVFTHTTTDSQFIDRVQDMRSSGEYSYEEIQEAYIQHVFHHIIQPLSEWLESFSS